MGRWVDGRGVLAGAAGLFITVAGLFSVARADPSFSWQSVPLYAHFGERQGLTDDQVAFIADRYDFITLEKMHGVVPHGTSEGGTLADAARLKTANPDAYVLFYWNLLLDYASYEASDTRGTDARWFVHDMEGNLSLKGSGDNALRRYDLTRPEVRDWWVTTAAQMVEHPQIDGVFVDALPQIAGNRRIATDLWGAEKAAGMEASIDPILAALNERIGPDALIIYNGIRSTPTGWAHGGLKYLNHADGAIVEHFALFKSAATEQIAQDIERMIEAGNRGKIVILKAFPGFTWLDDIVKEKTAAELRELAAARIEFPLAAFLVIANERSYFNYSWGYRADYGNLEWYPEFDRPLGLPNGPAVKHGTEYRREFEHASVYLNIATRTGKIDWR